MRIAARFEQSSKLPCTIQQTYCSATTGGRQLILRSDVDLMSNEIVTG